MIDRGPAGATTVEAAGLRLRIEAESEADLDLVLRVVGSATTDAAPDARLVIGSTGPSPPDRPPEFQGPYGDHWDDGTVHSFRHHYGLTAEVTPDAAVLGGPAGGYRRWVTVRNSMLFVLARLLVTCGRFMLHGAAVRHGDDALLVVGHSGAGKSSLAFAAHLHGWDVLGDDMVVVDDHDPMTVRGIPRIPTIPGEVAAMAAASSEIVGEPLPEDPRDRLELVGFRLDPRPAPIAGVLICAHDTGPGALEPVSTVDALQALVPAFVLSALSNPVTRWFPLAARLARGPVAELRHATDPEIRLSRAGELLDAALARATSDRP